MIASLSFEIEAARETAYSLFVAGGVGLDEELPLSDEVLAGLSADFLSEDLPSPSAEAFIGPAFGFAA
ncbi:MAG: hypothetical protein WCC27_17625 [Acidobacteriaceae bacterium]